MASNRYTDEDVADAVARNVSMRQTLLQLGLAPLGGNYKTLRRRIEVLQLSTDHWTGQAQKGSANKGGPVPTPLDEILRKGTLYKSYRLKARLIEAGHFEHKCYACGLSEWMDQQIPLELEHISGDSTDNRLENLTLLCPNCHAQTSTYRRRKPAPG